MSTYIHTLLSLNSAITSLFRRFHRKGVCCISWPVSFAGNVRVVLYACNVSRQLFSFRWGCSCRHAMSLLGVSMGPILLEDLAGLLLTVAFIGFLIPHTQNKHSNLTMPFNISILCAFLHYEYIDMNNSMLYFLHMHRYCVSCIIVILMRILFTIAMT